MAHRSGRKYLDSEDQELAVLKGQKNINGDTDAERQPFIANSPSAVPVLTSGPVRLTPGFEDDPANKDDLRNSMGNLADAPPDRFNLVYLILVIHGIGTLMPWNMFITAKSYFVDYKLTDNGVRSEYAGNFLHYLGFAAQVPNVFFNWLNIFIQIGGSLKTRIVWSIVVEVVLFIVTIVLAMLDTSDYPGAFFWLTMISVVVINMAGGIYQNSVYGIAAKLDYTGAVVLGSNISGTFAAIIQIVSMYMAPSTRTSAIYYFITALFVLLTCFDTYFALPLTKFYRYHEIKSAKEQERKRPTGQIGSVQKTPYLAVLRKCFPQCVNVFLVFFVTLSIFPTVYSDIKRTDENFIISEPYFTPVTCFLTFNLFAMFGNMIPGLVQWPGPKYLWIPIVMRFLFIPFFILCNYQPLSYEVVFLPSFWFPDWVYWAGGVLLGLTSGYYSSLAMMYCPRSVESEYAPVAGMFGAAFLITGIFVGINFSILIPEFVSRVPLGN